MKFFKKLREMLAARHARPLVVTAKADGGAAVPVADVENTLLLAWGAGERPSKPSEVTISVASEEGGDTPVATLGPGDVVGEISLIKGQKTTAKVTASSRVGALFLPRERFDAVIGTNDEVTAYLANLSEERLALLRKMVQAPELVDDDDLMLL